MTLTIEIPSEVASQILSNASRGDRKAVQKLLIDAITPAVESIMEQAEKDLSFDEFEKLSEKLINEFITSSGPDHQPLSDYAVSREGIYEDHL